ncbi:MAG: tRNA pseudouridine(55) synthase TruB [Planctomycetes bacterium]|nr:tRNA pseudouridine(55) synthase TruB [Planctomycetota bacterium]
MQGGSHAADLHGILLVDKPVGPTSMRVVERVRRSAGGARCGHAGTLDPLASGLLVIGIGSCTKQLSHWMAGDKRYESTMDLSAFTATDDSEGALDVVDVATPPERAHVERALQSFVGEVMQAPPAFSAVKIAGRRAYDLARREVRAGGDAGSVQPQARAVRVHAIDVVAWEWPLLTVRIHCDKGFYVRSLARDLGRSLETGGFCRSIRRTWSAPFRVEDALQLDALPQQLMQEHLQPAPQVQG